MYLIWHVIQNFWKWIVHKFRTNRLDFYHNKEEHTCSNSKFGGCGLLIKDSVLFKSLLEAGAVAAGTNMGFFSLVSFHSNKYLCAHLGYHSGFREYKWNNIPVLEMFFLGIIQIMSLILLGVQTPEINWSDLEVTVFLTFIYSIILIVLYCQDITKIMSQIQT